MRDTPADGRSYDRAILNFRRSPNARTYDSLELERARYYAALAADFDAGLIADDEEATG